MKQKVIISHTKLLFYSHTIILTHRVIILTHGVIIFTPGVIILTPRVIILTHGVIILTPRVIILTYRKSCNVEYSADENCTPDHCIYIYAWAIMDCRVCLHRR